MSPAPCRGGRRNCSAMLRTTRLRPAVATSAQLTYSTPSIYLLRESSNLSVDPAARRGPVESWRKHAVQQGAAADRPQRVAIELWECLALNPGRVGPASVAGPAAEHPIR